MASSKGSPGPHDRRLPRTKCIYISKTTRRRCTRWAVGQSKLCKSHKAIAEAEQARKALEASGVDPDTSNEANDLAAYEPTHEVAQPTPAGIQRGGQMTKVKKEAAKNFVIAEQARNALQKLGKNGTQAADPRQTLLDTVASAWRQQQVWEQMLAMIPEDDWQWVGVTPVPGSQHSAKGARIEAIQKFLGEATKTAARTSKLAIDAGIEERLVRLAEEQAALIADTVKAGVSTAVRVLARSLHLSPEAEANVLNEALGSAAHQLRLLATQPEAEVLQAAPVIEGQAVEVRRTFPDHPVEKAS